MFCQTVDCIGRFPDRHVDVSDILFKGNTALFPAVNLREAVLDKITLTSISLGPIRFPADA